MSSSPTEKKKAAKYIEEHLAPETRKAGSKAANASAVVTGTGGTAGPPAPFMPNPGGTFGVLKPGYNSGPGELKGWRLKSGLSHASAKWDHQVQKLLGRLTREMGALRQTNNLFQGNDNLTASRFQSQAGGNGPGLPHSKLYDLP